MPVYLDRTWLLLAAFIAWTGWQAGRDLGTGTALAYAAWLVVGMLIAVLGHEVAHAVAARLLGFRVHRILATLWGGHTAYDGTGTTPGRAALVAVGGPAANVALAALGALAMTLLPWPYDEFAWSFVILNGLLAGFNLLPGLPLDGGQLVESLVWGVSGRRDLGLLVAGWCGRALAVGVVLWFAAVPLANGDRMSSTSSSRWRWPGSCGAARPRRSDGLPWSASSCGSAPRTSSNPSPWCPPSRPSVTSSTSVDGSWRSTKGLPTLLLPAPSDSTPDIATLPAETRLASVVVRLPEDCVVEIAPGADVEPVLRAMATTGGKSSS